MGDKGVVWLKELGSGLTPIIIRIGINIINSIEPAKRAMDIQNPRAMMIRLSPASRAEDLILYPA